MSSFRTWVEINGAALRFNLRVAKRLAPQASIIAVLKADAYGHGIQQVAAAIKNNVSYFAVASLQEALKIEKVDRVHPILLLSPGLPGEYREIAAHGFIPTISSYEEARCFSRHAPASAQIHFKVDTGMGRLGVWYPEAESTLKRIQKLPLVVQSISTHLPSADSDKDYTRGQIALFKKNLVALRHLAPKATVHFLNSAGLLCFPKEAHDSVRIGLVLYGVSPLAPMQQLLRPVMTWKATVCWITKHLKGSTISYGRTYQATRAITVAILPVGYGDGYPRQVSGQGAAVLIKGKWAPVLGRVTMDELIVDITEIENVKIGDVAVLLGKQGDHEITATALAAKANTISWHLFTGITERVKRCYKNC